MTVISLSTTELEPGQIERMAGILSKFPISEKSLPLIELMAQGKNEIEVARIKDRTQRSVENELFSLFRATGLLGGSPERRGIWLGKAYALMQKNGGSVRKPDPEFMKRAHALMLKVRQLPVFQQRILIEYAKGMDSADIAAAVQRTEKDVLTHIGRAHHELGLPVPPNNRDREFLREAVSMLGATAGRPPETPQERIPIQAEMPARPEPKADEPVRADDEKHLQDIVARMKNLPFALQKFLPFVSQGLRHQELGTAVGVRAASAEASASSLRGLLGIRGLDHVERTALIKAAYQRFLAGGGAFEKTVGRPERRASAPSVPTPPAPTRSQSEAASKPDGPLSEKVDLRRKNGHDAAAHMPEAAPLRKPEERIPSEQPARAASDGSMLIALSNPEKVLDVISLTLDGSKEKKLCEYRDGYVPEFVAFRIGTSQLQVVFVKRER